MYLGGLKAEGAKHVLVPLVIDVVEGIINNEMEATVEELNEELTDVTEQSVLGAVMEEVQGKTRDTALVFYYLVRTAAWSKEQEEQSTLKDPTKICAFHQSGSQQLIRTYLWRVSFTICQVMSSRNRPTNKMDYPILLVYT